MNNDYKSTTNLRRIRLLICILFTSFGAFGQALNTETNVITATQFGVTRPLSEIFAENPVPDDFSIPKAEHPDKKNRVPQSFPLAQEGDPVFGNDESTIQRGEGQVESEGTKASWTGQTGTGRPFDPSGAVGPSHYIQMINATIFKVYDKASGVTLLTGNLGSLWSPAVPNYGDPVVMYDKAASRWFLAQFGSGNQIYIAVSQTASPLGAWYTYTYISPEFPDYLKFGIWHDAYYMTSNQGTQKVYAFNRSEILAGTPGARSIFVNYSPPNGGGFFCPLPADAGDGTLPAPGTPCPILSYSDNGWGAGFNDAVNIYNMSVNWVPAIPTATITLAANVATAAFNANYNPSWLDVSQPGTAQKLDGIGGVLMYRSQWKSFPGYNTLVLNWGVEISATQRGIKWCELRQTGGVWSMYQEGIYTPGADTRWMGSIAMNDQGSIGLCYMRSNSSTMFPSIYYTGRRNCDPLGTLPVTETLVTAGTASQFGFGNPNASKRVGDYAHMTIDPSNGTTFWATSEVFSGTSGTGAARTQVFSFDITPCVVLVAGVSITGSSSICAGSDATFTASPTNGGAAPVYQWKVNGVNVGINSPTFSSNALLAGDIVTCVMTSNLPGVTGNPATSNAITMVVSSSPTVGTATIASTICLGEPATIFYTPPTCELTGGFQNAYAPANWVLAHANSNGSVNTTLAPASITMVSSDNISGSAGETNYSITIPCSGNLSFDWAYSTGDGAQYDYPSYVINGGAPQFLPGYSTVLGTSPQNGSFTIAVNAGDVFTLRMYSADNVSGSCTTVFSNLSAPSLPNQHFDVFNAASGGSLLTWSYSGTVDMNPAAAGTYTYYVAAHDNVSSCYSTSRVPVTVVVHPTPTLGTASISPTPICLGQSAVITYTEPACETIIGFQNAYAPANWTLTQVNSNGTVTANAPTSITMVSSNIGSPFNFAEDNYSITVTCAGNITFDWNYSTVDGAQYDYPSYVLNGGAPQFLPGYSTSGASTQSGSFTLAVNAGDVFALRTYSVDNGGGPCTTVFSNFTAPRSTNQHFDVFDAATGGNLLAFSYSSAATVTPTTSGSITYYVAAHADAAPFCYSTTRIPVTVVVNPLPTLGSATASPITSCFGSNVTLNYVAPTCSTSAGFQNVYDPVNWVLAQVNSNGAVNTGGAPGSIEMISSNGLSGAGQTNYSITIPCSGNITFDWSYTTIDGAFYDYPAYLINGGASNLFAGFDIFAGLSPQSGTATIAVNAGDVFTLQAASSDNFAGSCNIVISNFSAPVNLPFQFVSWYDAATGGSAVGFGNPLNFTPPSGTATYYAEVTDFLCINPTRVATNSITIHPLPSVTSSASSAIICQGASTTLNASNALSYTWNPGTLAGNSVTVSPSATTLYTVVGTDANGCTNSSTVMIQVNSTPLLGTATATPASLCLGTATSLAYTPSASSSCNGQSITGFQGYYAPTNWTLTQTNSNGSVNVTTAPDSIRLTSSNGLIGQGSTSYSRQIPCSGIVTYNWNYTSVDGANWDRPRYTINGINPIVFPGFNISGSQNQSGSGTIFVNAGDILAFEAFSVDNAGGACTFSIYFPFFPISNISPQSVTWFSAPTGGTNLGNGNPQSYTPTATGSFSYYAQVTNTATGCSNTTRVATNTVVVNQPATANAGTAQNICAGTSATLAGTIGGSATTSTWSAPSGTFSNASSLTSTYTPSITNGTVTLTLTTNDPTGPCNAATSTKVITVNPLATANAGTAQTICAGTSATLAGTIGGSATTSTWSAPSGTFSNTSSLTSSYTPSITSGTVTLTLTTNDPTGPCNAVTSTVVITVNPVATANAGTAQTICAGTSATLAGTIGGSATTSTWSAPSGTFSNASSLTSNYTPSITSGTVTLTLTTNDPTGPCNAATSTKVITVNPVATANAGAAQTICAGSSATLAGTIGGGATTSTWSAPSGTFSNAASLTSSYTPSITSGTVTLTLTTNDPTGPCNAVTSTVVITVNPVATVNAGAAQTICAGSSVALAGTIGGSATTSTWSAPSGTFSNAASLTSSYTPSITSGNVTLTLTTNDPTGPCNAVTSTKVITVNPRPTVGTTASATTICQGNSTTLTGTGAVSYTWNPGAISGSPINVSPSATTTYTVTGTGANGCTNTSTRQIIVTPPCGGGIVNVKLFIEGYYIGAGLMEPVLANQSVGASSTITDTIIAELRSTSSPFGVVSTIKTILNTNGTATCSFPVSGTYYLAIRHRNAVATWSALPLTLVTGSPLTYDFSNAATKAYGANQVNMSPGVFAFYSGDVFVDENVDINDLGLIESGIISFLFGYQAIDITGDGNVDILDTPVVETNLSNFVFSAHP